uniref:NADH-ubiquinone oxidoreductase chain 5 n=1 Tax=Callopistes maculatus TaxID=271259 RepID=A0A348B081_9SAUR|nr:NADH dehydrogenase subunit 5 [Callopistes maculatus]
MQQLTTMFYTLTLVILSYPLFPITKNPNPLLLIKLALATSLIPMLHLINTQQETQLSANWWFTTSMDIKINFTMDKYSLIFTPIALFVSWSIMEFSTWYMHSDPQINRFFKYLMIFLFSMIILITSNNMFQFLIGWEGVGIMSFFLINWWFSRHEANTSALQAIIYNRIGDVGLILTTVWLAMMTTTWDLQLAFLELKDSHPILALGLLLAATGKSAQFGLHPWLPAAMEGPTPVSALLHSSTMVVAGIFLLIRTNPMLSSMPNILTLALCLGAISTLFSAICATTQNDIKKIIAFSTSSQLGLMMVAIGLNLPELAFFHICTHAFFKALLFLCSGTIIHTVNNQDIRKMGGLQKLLPLTSSCMTTGNLALMGTPFLSGFYSKDTIIEALCNSHLNAWALALTLIATMLTATYTLRMVFLTQMLNPRFPPQHTCDETSPAMKNSLLRLTMGSIIAGLTLTPIIYTKTQILTMPPLTKLAAIIVTLTGLILAHDLMKKTTMLIPPKKLLPTNFSTQLGFFNTMIHRTIPNITLNTAQKTSTQIMDQIWLEMIPLLTCKTQIYATKKTTSAQKGDIKTFLTAFLMTTALSLIMLMLNYS